MESHAPFRRAIRPGDGFWVIFVEMAQGVGQRLSYPGRYFDLGPAADGSKPGGVTPLTTQINKNVIDQWGAFMT